ncbi:hypothetical protein [Streptomyces sp. PT12]|uniref:hypothetical protein n=1 Tax=Streptomyces sp. PT12 TaxID=1510197 RepID=UPI0015EED604|nr:hypothetical protein [Streptomyces sp. PT12]
MPGIGPGMTPEQVESALGPPRDRLASGRFAGDDPATAADARWDTWLYTDFPADGGDTVVVFADGAVDHVMTRRRDAREGSTRTSWRRTRRSGWWRS